VSIIDYRDNSRSEAFALRNVILDVLPCGQRQRNIRLENENVTRARTGNIEAGKRDRRDMVSAANAGEKLAPTPDKTRKQPRTRLQLPRRGTNCAAG